MNKKLVFIPLALSAIILPIIGINSHVSHEVKAATGPTQASLSTIQNIDLNDNSEEEIREYYKDLNDLSDEEKKGTNILKNLKPILQNFRYYSYDAVWKIYEITDREWALSPASETTYGTYNAETNKITGYTYGTSNTKGNNNPYVHTLYRNRDSNGVTVESGRIREWGDHSQTGGTNREHVWCQSRGFKADSGANGPAGTDIHHLMSGDGYVNGKPHNDNPYGYVDPNNITINSATSYSYCAGNIAGAPLHPHAEDETNLVFEPQDSDKGDIARACFYMVACYNNLSGTDTITQYNPNLTLADYAAGTGTREDSSATHAVALGILSDLLEWHRLDPVDEYEIHRNNLIYNNYQHNRNPFIDFPQWVDYIWGDQKGLRAIAPASDSVYGEKDVTFSTNKLDVVVGKTAQISATTIDSSDVTWLMSDSTIASNNQSSSKSGEAITITGLKVGSTTLTASAIINSEVKTSTCTINVIEKEPGTISLSTSSLSVEEGSSVEISATSSDGSDIAWKVSDESIATVSKSTSASGEKITVKGVKAGTVKLTATSEIDGDTITSECSITVTAKEAFPILYVVIGAGVLLVVIIIIFAVPSLRKKAKKTAQKEVKKQVKKQTKSYTSKNKKK